MSCGWEARVTARKERGVCLLGTPPCHPESERAASSPRGSKGQAVTAGPGWVPAGPQARHPGDGGRLQMQLAGKGGAHAGRGDPAPSPGHRCGHAPLSGGAIRAPEMRSPPPQTPSPPSCTHCGVVTEGTHTPPGDLPARWEPGPCPRAVGSSPPLRGDSVRAPDTGPSSGTGGGSPRKQAGGPSMEGDMKWALSPRRPCGGRPWAAGGPGRAESGPAMPRPPLQMDPGASAGTRLL